MKSNVLKGMLRYTTGDHTSPTGTTMQYVFQLCDDSGNYNCKTISKKYPQVESQYRYLWRMKHGKLMLGDIQTVNVRSDVAIVNVFSKKILDDKVIVDLENLKNCFRKAGSEIIYNGGSVHLSKTSYEEANCDWKDIEKLIDSELINRGISVTVYS